MEKEIRTASLIRGTETRLNEGVTLPSRALARVEGEQPFVVILKRLPAEAVAAECFAALLLRAWGVPVPEPFLIKEDDQLHFGSKEAEYPNLKQRLNIEDNLAPEVRLKLIHMAAIIVSGLPETPMALVADEAIDNRDRNLGNVLWDGQNAAFVDHERAFGLQNDDDVNKLAAMANMVGQAEKMERAAVTLALTVRDELVHDVSKTSGIESEHYAEYVAARVKNLASRVLARFPKPVDLLNGQTV